MAASPGRPRLLRWCLRAAIAGGALLALLGLALWFLHRRASAHDPRPHFRARQGELAQVRALEPRLSDEHSDQDVWLRSSSGLEVELALRRSRTAGIAGARVPAALVLGGLDTGRRAAELVPDAGGVLVAAMSYPTRVRRVESFADLGEARRALLDTPAALLLAVDYLSGLAEVDTARIELVGVSLGAPFVCTAGAMDARVARVWVVHGGGDPQLLLAHALQDDLPPPLAWIGGHVLALVAHGPALAPERWVGGLAPRPFEMIQAEGDERIPAASAARLWEAAREPKRLQRVTGGHADKLDEAQLAELCAGVLRAIEAAPAGS